MQGIVPHPAHPVGTSANFVIPLFQLLYLSAENGHIADQWPSLKIPCLLLK